MDCVDWIKVSPLFFAVLSLHSENRTKTRMAASLLEPPFSANHSLFSPSHLSFKPLNSKPTIYFSPLLRSPTSRAPICLCAADEIVVPPPPLPLPADTSQEYNVSLERSRDRRKVVRVAWEKLVRWSRSWRSKAKTDVLERTNKVSIV